MVLKHEHVVWPGLCAHCSSVVCQTDLQSVCADVEVNQLRLEGESQVNLGSVDLQLNVLFTSESTELREMKDPLQNHMSVVFNDWVRQQDRIPLSIQTKQTQVTVSFPVIWASDTKRSGSVNIEEMNHESHQETRKEQKMDCVRKETSRERNTSCSQMSSFISQRNER